MENIRYFYDALEERLTYEDWSRPLDILLKEVGYTKDLASRLKDHQTHTSSNYLMNLTEAILRVGLEQKNISIYYTIKQHVLYYCWHSE